MDCNNRQLPDALDPSTFTNQEVINFISSSGAISRASIIVPPSVASALQTQLNLNKTLLIN